MSPIVILIRLCLLVCFMNYILFTVDIKKELERFKLIFLNYAVIGSPFLAHLVTLTVIGCAINVQMNIMVK